MPQTKPPPELQSWLLSLPNELDGEVGFQDVLAALAAGSNASVDGAWGSACALTTAALAQHAPESIVVICEGQKAADSLLADLPTFSDAPHLRFPAWTTDPGERLVYDDTYADRLRTLKQLISSPTDQVVITSIQSLSLIHI